MTRPSTQAALRALARWVGVQTTFLDMAHRPRPASTETLLAVLGAWGVPVERPEDAGAVLRRLRRGRLEEILPPVQVAWQGPGATVDLRLPETNDGRPWRLVWHLEEGGRWVREARRLEVRRRSPETVEGFRTVRMRVSVPEGVPTGYHEVEWQGAGGLARGWVFVAPRRCWSAGRQRDYGLFAPLYALHSQRSWGVGDYGDLERWVEWIAGQGGRVAGTLPLLPAFLRSPCEPSPYSPVTRLGWNELFLDLSQVPELEICGAARKRMESAAFRRALARVRRGALVDYPEVMRLKREVLELLSRELWRRPSARRRALETFLRRNPGVADYARFRAVGERMGLPWLDWPARLRDGTLQPGDGSVVGERVHAYGQWLAHEQVARVSRRADELGVALYLDMPLGTHREGYDAWRFRGLFAENAAGGAPPDPVFTQGQDWGFAPLHPERSRRDGHAYFRATLRHHLRQARMLRFDHVMGLHRLYWVPRGLPAAAGAYVTYPAEEFYAALTIESHRHRARIVGENLGTVPPEVDRSLRRHRIAGMYVAQYEFQPSARRVLRPVPRPAVASVNTHDMPPWHAWCRGLDLIDRLDLGLLRSTNLKREKRLRQTMLSALGRQLSRSGFAPSGGEGQAGSVLAALWAFLAASPAEVVLLNLEDLWLELESQNVPGTSGERINWRRKARYALEALSERPEWLERLRQVRRRRRSRGKSGFPASSKSR